MSRSYRTVAYRDELLTDGTARRSYDDGRQEWRRRGPGPVVSWRDDRGNTGTDETIGMRILKRSTSTGAVLYGRELGYGRTAWSDGILTVNRTSLGGRAGAVLAGIGAAGLLSAIVDPPMVLTAADEEALRQQEAARTSSGDGGELAVGVGDSGGYHGDSRDEDWSGTGDGSGDDFG